jgi:hypothetical protein
VAVNRKRSTSLLLAGIVARIAAQMRIPLLTAPLAAIVPSCILCLACPLRAACRCKPSVVHIASLGDAGSYYSPLQLDPERVPMGMGSGFMWDKEVSFTALLHLLHCCYFRVTCVSSLGVQHATSP